MENTDMLSYVSRATDVMRLNIDRADDLVGPLVDEYVKSGKKSVCLVASGSSFNASLAARNYMQDQLGCRVDVVSPEAYMRYEAGTLGGSFTMVASQSGCSTNILDALDYMGVHERRRISLTGNLQSDIVEHSDAAFDYGCGIEACGYVTQGVEALILFLVMFAVKAAKAQGRIDAAGEADRLAAISEAVDAHEDVVSRMPEFYESVSGLLARNVPMLIAGTGPSYGVAQEGALKIMETVKRPCMAYEIEEFLHGPDYQLTPDYAVLLLGFEVPSNLMKRVYEGVSKVTQATLLFSDEVDSDDPRQFAIPALADPRLVGIPALAVVQYLSARVTDELKRWPNHPFFESVWWNELNSKTSDYQETRKKVIDAAE